MGGWSGDFSADGRAIMGLQDSLIGFAAGFGPLYIAWIAGGIGGGDAKVMGSVGALVGWQFTLTSMLCGFAVAIVMSFVIMIRHKITFKTLGRIWNFLLLTVMKAKPESPGGSDSKNLPFGFALCLGTIGVMLVYVIMKQCGVSNPEEKIFFITGF